MSATLETAAPTGRKKIAQGKERSAAALGNPQIISGPEGAKKEGVWPVAPLGELAADERNAITDGPFGSKLKTDHYTVTGPRVIRLKNIGDTDFVDAKAHISEEHFATLQKHRVFPGDVVIAALGEDPPRSCLVPEHLGPAIVKADCIRFKAGSRILPKFINYVLNAPDLRRYAKRIVHGVGRPRLNLSEIKALPIPVPLIPEQRRIVAEIEKQFTRLEAGVAALRRVQANLTRYRAAVLKVACEGKLVENEAQRVGVLSSTGVRANDNAVSGDTAYNDAPFESGEALLQRILAERRKHWEESNRKSKTKNRKYVEPAAPDTANLPSLPEGWTWATLDALAAIKGGITKDQNRKHTAPARSIPYLRVANVQRGYLDFSEVKEIVTTEDEIHEFDPEKRRHPFQRRWRQRQTRSRLGLDDELPECIHQNHVFRARLFDTGLNPKLVSWYANTFGQKFFFDEGKHTTNLASISLTKLKGLPVPVPAPAEQTRIVAEVERRLSVVEELESVVSANLQRTSRLRQSILQKAVARKLA